MVSRRLEALQRRLSTTVARHGRSTGVKRSLSCVVIWYNPANSMTCSSRRSSLVAPTRTGGHKQSHLPPFTRVPRRQKLKGVKRGKGFRGSNETMRKTMLAVLVTVAFSAVGVLGDYFLKLLSARDQPLRTRWFYVGFAVYASTAFGWVFVMRHLKLATISVVYSISMVLLLTAVGVVLFGESLNYYELAGIVLAVASLVLLMRFA